MRQSRYLKNGHMEKEEYPKNKDNWRIQNELRKKNDCNNEETRTNFKLETISDYLKFRKKNVHSNYIVYASKLIN